MPISAPSRLIGDRAGNQRARRLELARQPVHVLFPVFGALAITGILIVAGAAREVRRRRVLRAGKRAIADAVAVHVLIAPPGAVQLLAGLPR